MSRGYVYILTNPAMPGLVKIGKTTRSVAERAHELNQTGVPMPFVISSAIYSPNCHEMEESAHKHFESLRISQAREFFKCAPDEADGFLREYLQEQVYELVDQFMPGYSLVEDYAFIDPSTVDIVSERCGQHPAYLDPILLELTPEELAPAVERFLHKISLRADAQRPCLVVVGGGE